MPNLDPTYVRHALHRIARARIEVFGAEQHRFTLLNPLPESDAVASSNVTVSAYRQTIVTSSPKSATGAQDLLTGSFHSATGTTWEHN
jgi:hypothetical protein